MGNYNMFNNKFDQDRTKVCPEIEKMALCWVDFKGTINVSTRK